MSWYWYDAYRAAATDHAATSPSTNDMMNDRREVQAIALRYILAHYNDDDLAMDILYEDTRSIPSGDIASELCHIICALIHIYPQLQDDVEQLLLRTAAKLNQ